MTEKDRSCLAIRWHMHAFRNALVKSAHDALRTKLLPKVYEYGFLNPDVQLFQ